MNDIINRICSIVEQVKKSAPLIHCITNPISINDCANAVLSVGGKPIMAQHPNEVSEITAVSNAFAANLGNITDTRLKSIMLSGMTAKKHNIPQIIDIVGVCCSKLRLEYAQDYISKVHPDIIKGNISEIMALSGEKYTANSIDAAKSDICLENNIATVKKLSLKAGAVILASGKTDIISDGTETSLIYNGCDMLPLITGTGCMLNALTGAYLSSGDILGSALAGAAALGIAGEMSANAHGTGSFKVALMDNLYNIDSSVIREKIKISRV